MTAKYPFTRANSIGWAYGEILTSAQMNTADDNAASGADGSLWTDLAMAKNWYEDPIAMGFNFEALGWNPGDRYWYAFGTNGTSDTTGVRSYNGRHWDSITIPTDGTLTPAAVAANSAGTIIVGGNAGSDATKIRQSTNGTTWNTRSTVAAAGANVSHAVWHSAASLFVIGLSNSATTNIETSPTGATWTQRTGLPNSNARGPFASNGTIVVSLPSSSVGATTAAMSSTDCVTWTARTLPTSQVWLGVIWDSRYERFLAFGETNFAYSSNGTSWTNGGALPVSFGGNPALRVVNVGRVFLAYGIGDDKGYAGYFDGSTIYMWKVIDTGDQQAAAASDGQFMITDTGGSLYRTLSCGG